MIIILIKYHHLTTKLCSGHLGQLRYPTLLSKLIKTKQGGFLLRFYQTQPDYSANPAPHCWSNIPLPNCSFFKVHLLNSEGEVKFTSRHKEDVLRWHWHWCYNNVLSEFEIMVIMTTFFLGQKMRTLSLSTPSMPTLHQGTSLGTLCMNHNIENYD